MKKASKTKEKKETNLEERETTEEIKLKENKVKPTFNNILRKMNENTDPAVFLNSQLPDQEQESVKRTT